MALVLASSGCATASAAAVGRPSAPGWPAGAYVQVPVDRAQDGPARAGDVVTAEGSLVRNGTVIVPADPPAAAALGPAGPSRGDAVAPNFGLGDVVCKLNAYDPVEGGGNAAYYADILCSSFVNTLGIQVCAAIYATNDTWVLLQCQPSGDYKVKYVTDFNDDLLYRYCTPGRRYRTYAYSFATYNNTAFGNGHSGSLYC